MFALLPKNFYIGPAKWSRLFLPFKILSSSRSFLTFARVGPNQAIKLLAINAKKKKVDKPKASPVYNYI
jgi:hypothetical protein